MTISLPHRIDNDHGEVLLFDRIVTAPEGETLLLRNEVQPGCGPVMHVHFQQEEALTVTEGRLGYQFEGDVERFAEVGETVVFPAGRPHRFWAEGEEVLRCDGYVRPPHNVVWFLSEIYESSAGSKAGKPNDLDAAFLLGRYGDEYDIPAVPAPVRRIVFPVLRMIGRLTGRNRKFANAPEPVDTTRVATRA